MPQDAFTLRFHARELDEMLKGGKINKINQPEREELSLLIYTGKRTVKLTINANASDCGIYFTDDEKDNPLVAPNFCMLLRKRLQNAEILGVEQIGFERILAIRLMCFSDFSACERVLYAEIMGKYSNVVLTENGVILGALKTTSLDEGYRRILLPGATYTFPDKQDKISPDDLSALQALLSSPQEDMPRFLFTHVAGIALSTAQAIVSSFRGGSFAKHVYDYVFSSDSSPCVTVKDGEPVDFCAKFSNGAIPFETLSEAQSYFYTERRKRKAFSALSRKLKSALDGGKKKQEKRLSQILEKYRECEDREQNRIRGELLTANLYALEKGMRSCEIYNYYDEAGGTEKILLDPLLTPSQNAQKYFKKYQKQRRTVDALAPQEAALRTELDYTNSLLSLLAKAENLEDLFSIEEELISVGLVKPVQTKAKKKRAEIPFRTFEKDGFQIFAGRNNLQNDLLVKKSAPDDVWLHTQKYHSSHVVVKAQSKPVPQEVVEFAARICARYSDGKEGTKIPVDYTLVRYVKKTSKSKAGFVVYTDYKTILVDPL